ncbi:putative transmembrane GTPase FZO-like, chloroplastic [Drosera capensis]
MLSLCCAPSTLPFSKPTLFPIHPQLLNSSHLKHSFPQILQKVASNSVRNDNTFQPDGDNHRYLPLNSESRTLYPGGYKRPEIKVPSIVLRVAANEVLGDGGVAVLDVIDEAVAKEVKIVVVSGGDSTGGRLYQAACLLKSVVRDRAYLLIDERVDIAAAVNASGVVVSDQGLPTVVARNVLMGSNSISTVLPVVGRSVRTVDAAISASNSEGADFLIFSTEVEGHNSLAIQSMYANVKTPIFVVTSWNEDGVPFHGASNLITIGASGLVLPFKGLKLLTGDAVSKLLSDTYVPSKKFGNGATSAKKHEISNAIDGVGGKRVAGFVKLEDREFEFIRKERQILLEAVNIIQKAAPLMVEVSLLKDAISQLDDPFMMVIVGEFNSGKSTLINALLGGKFLKDGVVPTTNEITFLYYGESDYQQKQRSERHPDGRFIHYLPAEFLREMVIVDTPGTNVILQRQQRLTEEFVPRADLLLFVISADRPLTESEVTFLRYTQQWKKKVVFVLNKSDMYQTADELQQAVTFVKENVQRLLNVQDVTLFPVSARSALEVKISSGLAKGSAGPSRHESCHSAQNFNEFEKFLYSFLDGSTSAGLERMKIKLETPMRIAERLLSACQTLVTQDLRRAKQDLDSVEELISSANVYTTKLESDSLSWRRRIAFLIGTTQDSIVKLVESTVQLSNVDIAASYVLRGSKSGSTIAATSSVQNDIVGPALQNAKMLLRDYSCWLRESKDREAMRCHGSFEKRWSSSVGPLNQVNSNCSESLMEVDDLSLKWIEKYSAASASQLFDLEIRDVFLGTFGGLGAAGLSASLLTSVLSTTLEDLLALGLCSAGGFLAVVNLPARRQKMVDKVKYIADTVTAEIEEAMQKQLSATVKSLQNFVQDIGKPYREAAQERIDELVELQGELTNVEGKLNSLQIELQNFHLS